ncbi:MAG: type II toxin-antitoxin system Phd/YefM family antitoxin [Planctomycetes bacterium]|nr:type II toxin-antitoxin system Phd/YefM family antitoxin [Planctomycetota bacterium]
MVTHRRTTSTKSAIGVFNVKQHLSEILDRVEKGESIVITRHGGPVARLVPFTQPINYTSVVDVINNLKKLRKGVRLPKGVTIRQLIDEGRP